MSNTRRYKAGRRIATVTLKQENAQLRAMVKFQSDEIERLQRQPVLARPADLEDWINEVALGDMNSDERAEWDAMSDDERNSFVDALGQRLAVAENLPG